MNGKPNQNHSHTFAEIYVCRKRNVNLQLNCITHSSSHMRGQPLKIVKRNHFHIIFQNYFYLVLYILLIGIQFQNVNKQ